MLTVNDFPAFFRELWGYEAFPWQKRLADCVVKQGRWPELLDLPTGAGKTATLEIAVFHLALEAGEGEARKAPTRILFVVDRRIIVDAAFDRARALAVRLEKASSGVLRKVAERLKLLAGPDAPPLDVVRLRGGVPQERGWARSPAQPLIAVSTVDQVGSRLLFRGYGVSRRMRPIHAGLVGSDALWLLDEVHLSQPFQQTLEAINGQHRASMASPGLWPPRLAPFGIVKLSATPGAHEARKAFQLSDEDLQEQRLARRLAARKLAALEQAGSDMIASLTEHALRLADLHHLKVTRRPPESGPGVQRIAVVVNRVHVARDVFHRITETVGDRADVLLLTGRVRPLDRNRIQKDLAPVYAGVDRPQLEKPIIVVATQTIEVGADLDFDALVTEIAPLDSLRQRFGRLDRLGLIGSTQAVVLYPRGKPTTRGKSAANDWNAIGRIYGESAYSTLQWLQSLNSDIDFGTNALDPKLSLLSVDDLTSLLAPRLDAPVLLPPYSQLWGMTSPAPQATPEPSLFLHGPTRPPDVNVVWRADVPANSASPGAGIEHIPPTSLEALPVPIWSVQRWLQAVSGSRVAARGTNIPSDVADVPTEMVTIDDTQIYGDVRVWRWRNSEWEHAAATEIQPGDTILVDARLGGCDEFGWNPESTAVVADLGVKANYLQRLRGAIVVTRASLANHMETAYGGDADSSGLVNQVWSSIAGLVRTHSDSLDGETARSVLLEIASLPPLWRRILGSMENRQPVVVFCDPERPEDGFVLFARRRLEKGLLDPSDTQQDETPGSDAVTGYANSSAADFPVPLLQHLEHAERWATFYASRAGLNERLAYLTALAARLHDIGKCDLRFQADLYGFGAAGGGAELIQVLMAGRELLAKSERRGSSVASRRGRATPENFRHEALSIALTAQHPAVQGLEDDERDLVLWLVGTHHGHGRPFFPPYVDSNPTMPSSVAIDDVELAVTASDAPVRVDQGWFELAQRVIQQYGPWELARLETIVRLADHAASAGRFFANDTEENETFAGDGP